VGGVINLMYSRYEKFKKWITRPPLSRPAGKPGAVLKIDKAANSPGAGPPLGVEELRRRRRC
jgi:hypothetical protein